MRRVLLSGWLTTGPVAHEFERQFAGYVGCKHALAVNSGTAALQLALDAIGLEPGDEVLVPTYTFTATAEVVTYFGAKPVLCDSAAGGFNLDVADAARRVTAKTKALIPVHIGGEPCDMEAIGQLAASAGLHVIEDAAHALPAAYKGKMIGSISPLNAFSFYATKSITTGEGGMLTTDRDEYAERAATMRLHGIGRDAWKRYSRAGSWSYEVRAAGYKLNLCDVLAALGLTQLQKCDQFWQRRANLAELYRSKLAAVEELEMPPDVSEGSRHAWHLFVLRLRSEQLEINRDEFIEQLKQTGIGTSVHFIPLHRHPYYNECYGYSPATFPNAEDAFQRCLSLPIYPDLAESQVQRIVDSVVEIVRRSRRGKCVVV